MCLCLCFCKCIHSVGSEGSCVYVAFVCVHIFVCVIRADGVMRTMNTEKLIKTLPIIQNQLDALLDFQVNVT